MIQCLKFAAEHIENCDDVINRNRSLHASQHRSDSISQDLFAGGKRSCAHGGAGNRSENPMMQN